MPERATICGLVPAAGLSGRMRGRFKPLMPFRGMTIIESSVGSVLAGGAERVAVVTGRRAGEVEDVLSRRYGSRVLFARNPDPAGTDMLRSIQLGCAVMPKCEAFFLLPGDMPLVRAETFARLIRARDGSETVLFPTFGGRRTHPPLIDARLIPDILALRGEGGLRALWRERPALIRELPVDDEGVFADIDTMDHYNRFEHDTEGSYGEDQSVCCQKGPP